MSDTFALLPLIAPATLCLVAVFARLEPGPRPRRVLWASRTATLAALGLAAVVGAVVALYGTLGSPVVGLSDIGLSVRLDPLSAVMFGLVAFIGVIVVQFSRNYLDGDSRQGAFLGGLCLTLAAVFLLVLAGNLFQLVAGWIATSLALQRLLLFYRDRPRAVVAARKRFIISRVGDVCLIAAAVLLAQAFSSAHIGAILESARTALASGEIPAGAQLAAILLAIAALLKSAQFPTHSWLPEVMEAPTPVSALLHAGIVNAGGFLIVRFADVVVLSAPSLHLLALVGGFTALLASIIMLTQTSVKVSLAYSTVAQMGFMLFQCGIGAFSVAVVHIVAHSLYKAHAFLSSGSTVEGIRAASLPIDEGRRHPAFILASLAGALIILVAVGELLGVSVTDKPAVMGLGAILVMGLAHLLARAMSGKPSGYVLVRTAVAAAGLALVYLILETGAENVLASVVPVHMRPDAITIGIIAIAVGAFGLVTAVQLLAPTQTSSPRWRAAYVHLKNGFYVNVLFDRLIGALRRSPTVSP